MYTAAVLLDVHTRAHESLRRLVVHCTSLAEDELSMPLHGFGFPTVFQQLQHTLGAELYWQTVVTRGYHEEAALPDLSSLAAIEAFRRDVASATRAYVEGATDDELNTPRAMTSDPGVTRVLRPADVVLRIVTHIFNHQGQILSMCRALGKPNETIDLDYPIEPVLSRVD